MSTAITLFVFGGGLILSLMLWTSLLWLGLHLTHVPNVTMHRLVAATIITVGISLAGAGVSLLLQEVSLALSIVAALAINYFVPLFVIVRVFKASFAASLIAWAMSLLSTAMMLAVVYLGIRPYVLEAYHSPSNSMAPTLLGPHWKATCPQCGSPNYCSRQRPGDDDPALICRDHFHLTTSKMYSEVTHTSDKFLAAKYLTPQRWDIIVFRHPSNPSTLYVMRLVGLPGEEITIRDGGVWADGVALPPPDNLREITYEDDFPDRYFPIWGSSERSAKLGNDEYFVLGDFTLRSNDSRMWQEGAERHNVFAVPRSHIVGVVTHVYWPLERLRILR